MEELETTLEKLGFGLNSDYEFFLHNDSSLHEVVDKRIAEHIGSWDDVNLTFDELRVAMMTVETLADAQKLLQSANAFCVAK